MRHHRHHRPLPVRSAVRSGRLVAVAAIVLAGCGGDDDGSSAGDASATATEGAPAGDTSATSPPPDTGDDDTGDAGGGGTGDVTCDTMFSLDEIETWFGEPATVTADSNESLGQTTCTWETVEDSADVDDLTASGIIAQFFSGDPIPAESFVDASLFDEVRELDGIADVAFAVEELGMSYYFVDGGVAGSFNVYTIDLSGGDAAEQHTVDETDELFATFVERVTR